MSSRSIRRGLICVAAALLLGSLAFSQTREWAIDPVHSTARLFVESSARPDVYINVGVARVTGEILENGQDHVPSQFDFQIYPADRQPDQVRPESATYQPRGFDTTAIIFKTQNVDRIDPHTVRVTGSLTVSYITQLGDYEPFLGYSGPIWGPRLTHETTQQGTFEFRRVAQNPQEWIGELTAQNQASPVLWNAAVTTNWPKFVADGKTIEPAPRTDLSCYMSSSDLYGGDFNGYTCTGTPLVALPIQPDQTPQPIKQNKRYARELANQLKIRLHLRLTNARNTETEKSKIGNGKKNESLAFS